MYPILFKIGHFELSAIWFFGLIGFIIAVKSFLVMTQKRKLKLNIFFENPFSFILIPIIIGRLFGLIRNFSFTDIFIFWNQKFSFWAAIISFTLLLYYKLKENKELFLPWLDSSAPSLLIALIFGNIGKILDGAGYGKPTDLPFGITYENINVYYTVPVHPTQIYQLIYILIILFVGFHLYKNTKYLDKDGDLGLFCVFSYCIFRFFEEFLRGDSVMMLGTIRLPQLIALLLAVITGFLFFNKSNRKFIL